MNRNISKFRYLLLAISLFAVSCQDDFPELDYTVEGEDVELTVPLSLPKIDGQSRANMQAGDLNRVENLWIATYSATSKQRTTEEPDGWLQLEPGTTSTEFTDEEVTLKTKSGSSYIVAVANVDNMGIDKTDETMTPRPLRELLAAADTWDKFLNIAVVSPSTYDEVYSPDVPLAMAGAYTNIAPGKPHNPLRPLSDWQTENFQSYTIAASSTGKVTIEGTGAIHLRRLVSHINFQVIPGAGVKVTPNSYRIVNVPKYSWLYERSADRVTVDGKNEGANFGDRSASEEDAKNYYATPSQFSGTAFYDLSQEQLGQDYKTGSFGFDFWQAENKHTGIQTSNDYNDRSKEKKVADDGSDHTVKNTGIFTSLSGENWTPNNMATYVVLNCTVEHDGKINVDDEGAAGSTPAYRTGVGNYYIHLGYMGNDARDFNCYRNTNYTYRMTINGLEDIRLEAWTDETRPDVEGMVSDILNPTINLDCHYHSFNVYLTDDDLKKWDNVEKKGFGFIIYTYEDGIEHVVRETTYPDGNIPTDQKKYVNWIELRPTTGEGVLAMYKPNDGSAYDDDKTFNLVEASVVGIQPGDKRHSTSHWYTVFVNEYAYEQANANEQSSGRPVWMSYVMQNPRRFYLRVTQSISPDGESTYARSKYAGVQQSIMTYYSREGDRFSQSAEEGKVNGSAVGVERFNESYGLNLRRSYTGASDPNNGRYNTYQYVTSKGSDWFTFLDGDKNDWTTKPQEIQKGRTGYSEAHTVANHNPEKLPRLKNFEDMGGSLSGSGLNNDGNTLVNETTNYDIQLKGDLTDEQYQNTFVEAINACMNRNRDNNGNGVIDREEIRWYVPTMGKYLRLILGNKSLDYPLMDYDNITKIADPLGNYADGKNDLVGQYMFFGSEGRVLWAMEGLSTSAWCQWGVTSPVAPWQIRCVRNLGTNLKAEINTVDKTIPAYTFTPRNGDKYRGGIVEMSYYEATNNRVDFKSGNTSAGMPVHPANDLANNSIYYKFEISQGVNQYSYSTYVWRNNRPQQSGTATTNFYYDVLLNNSYTSEDIREEINKNPCSGLGADWRVPNLKELAIMRNIGIFAELGKVQKAAFYNPYESPNSINESNYNETAYNDSHSVPSCTVSPFNISGILKWPDNLAHKLMATTRLQINQTRTGPFYIRCVRDVR